MRPYERIVTVVNGQKLIPSANLTREMTAHYHFSMSNIFIDYAAVAVAGAVAASTGNADGWAAVGAALAAITVFHDTKAEGKNRFVILTSTLLSLFFGTALPGALLYTWTPEFAGAATRHVWAILGFLMGIVGMAVPPACSAVRMALLKLPWGRLVDRWFREKTKDKE